MAENSRIILYCLLALSVLLIIYYTAPFVVDRLRSTHYSFTVYSIDQSDTMTGEIIHLSDADLVESPALNRVLRGESYDSGLLREEEYHFYQRNYPNYSQNITGKRVYYEYNERFFYLVYIQDDRYQL